MIVLGRVLLGVEFSESSFSPLGRGVERLMKCKHLNVQVIVVLGVDRGYTLIGLLAYEGT